MFMLDLNFCQSEDLLTKPDEIDMISFFIRVR